MSEDLGAPAREALVEGDFLEWIAEGYGASGIGVSGFALFVLFAGAIGLFNWTESFKVPAVWLALMTPLMAVALPVPAVMRIFGIITVAVAMLFVALWTYWWRS